jgi:hypothetical protein
MEKHLRRIITAAEAVVTELPVSVALLLLMEKRLCRSNITAVEVVVAELQVSVALLLLMEKRLHLNKSAVEVVVAEFPAALSLLQMTYYRDRKPLMNPLQKRELVLDPLPSLHAEQVPSKPIERLAVAFPVPAKAVLHQLSEEAMIFILCPHPTTTTT